MIKARRALYPGNKWVLLVWTIVFFPVALYFFMRNAVWIEQDITPEQLVELQKAHD